jgi:hypothetical protein
MLPASRGATLKTKKKREDSIKMDLGKYVMSIGRGGVG